MFLRVSALSLSKKRGGSDDQVMSVCLAGRFVPVLVGFFLVELFGNHFDFGRLESSASFLFLQPSFLSCSVSVVVLFTHPLAHR